MRRSQRQREIARLDPVADCAQVYRLLAAHEFPWDTAQALSLALFRTYAVPSIGGLLARTGEFTERTQKRYDDTALLLDAVLEHGPGSVPGRDALRRVNAMHRAYDLPQDELRYVLSTLVVVPVRWLAAYGWRPLTPGELTATVQYYRQLGRCMGIRDLPTTWEGFAALMDAYERAHFAPDEGARQVAAATLDLLATFRPSSLLPRPLARRCAHALLDEPLLDALGLPRPPAALRRAVGAGLRARARVVRLLPPRRSPRYARHLPQVRSYPHGYDVGLLGTFPAGCPVAGAAARARP